MKRIFYLHWNENELKEKVASLQKLEVKIVPHWDTNETAHFPADIPDVFVINLERLPSHGAKYAQSLWEAKSRQLIPIIFVGGESEKVELIKMKFPTATFVAEEKNLMQTLKKVLSRVK